MIDLLVRTTLILGATWLVCRVSSRATAATRHLLWHLAVVAVLAAPLAMPIVPTIQVPGVPEVPPVSEVPKAPSTTTMVDVPAITELTLLWPIGSVGVFAWYAAAHLAGARRIRRARCASEALQTAAGTMAGHPVPLLIASDDTGPFVAGIVRPSIVLPAGADSWDADRVRAVLRHELAHVRRGDCRVQFLAQIACAVYWFNPLVWVAARALRTEREQACDDEVLACGTTPSVYAAELLGLARARQRQWSSPAVLAMARPSELERRLHGILAAQRARVPARTTRFAVAGAMCAVAVVALGARSAPHSPAGHVRDARAPLAAFPNQDDRERAALKLALDASPEAIPALIEALQDGDSQVREKAALGLGWRRDDRVITPLITALGDDDSQVREKAAIALGSSGDTRALAPLEAALRNDPDGEVRDKAAAALALLHAGGDPEANGRQVRDALNLMVSGLLRLAQ